MNEAASNWRALTASKGLSVASKQPLNSPAKTCPSSSRGVNGPPLSNNPLLISRHERARAFAGALHPGTRPQGRSGQGTGRAKSQEIRGSFHRCGSIPDDVKGHIRADMAALGGASQNQGQTLDWPRLRVDATRQRQKRFTANSQRKSPEHGPGQGTQFFTTSPM